MKGAVLAGRRLLTPLAVAPAQLLRLPSPSVVGCVPQRGLRPLHPVGVERPPPHPPSLRLRAGALRLRATFAARSPGPSARHPLGFPAQNALATLNARAFAGGAAPAREGKKSENLKSRSAGCGADVLAGGGGGPCWRPTTSTVHSINTACLPSVRPPVCWERFSGTCGGGDVHAEWLIQTPGFRGALHPNPPGQLPRACLEGQMLRTATRATRGRVAAPRRPFSARCPSAVSVVLRFGPLLVA